MDKDIKTLKDDLYHVLSTGEGWSKEISEWVGELASQVTLKQMTPRDFGKSYLRMSKLGQPGSRKLWYSLQEWTGELKETLAPYAKNKF